MPLKAAVKKTLMEVSVYQEIRLIWIDYHLSMGKALNRADLEEAFLLSAAGAANDIKKYKLRFPENIQYDTRRKAYFRKGPCSAYDFKVRKAVYEAQRLVKKAMSQDMP